jgi:two-component system, chemotaxis family, chemotaxis protein CheY
MTKTIMVVEYFAPARNLMKTHLEKAGYTVITAGDGNEALKNFDGQQIDLLITDQNMPIMSGIQLVKHIRESAIYTAIPVLMVTTEMNDKIKQAAFEIGIVDWVKKPFAISVFLDTIKRMLIDHEATSQGSKNTAILADM